MTLLMKKDILTEDEAKFYMAESVTSFKCPFIFLDFSCRSSPLNELYTQRSQTR